MIDTGTTPRGNPYTGLKSPTGVVKLEVCDPSGIRLISENGTQASYLSKPERRAFGMYKVGTYTIKENSAYLYTNPLLGQGIAVFHLVTGATLNVGTEYAVGAFTNTRFTNIPDDVYFPIIRKDGGSQMGAIKITQDLYIKLYPLVSIPNGVELGGTVCLTMNDPYNG